MNDSATQIEEHLTSLQPSLDELECLGDPDLLWPEKGQPWPPSVERYVHRFMHETNLYQVYRSTEVKFGKLVRLLATQVLPARSIKIHDSIARRCKQLITQSSRRWYSAGWLGLRGKTYYKKDPFQQCWNTHAAALAAKSIAVREDPRKKVLSVPELLLSNADGDGQAKPGTTERRLGDQSCRIGAQTLPIFKPQDRNSSRPPLYVASPTLSSGPGASERGFLTPPIEHNRHRSALASFPRVGSSLTAAPASLHRANLPRANTRFATALASLPRIDTSIITPPSPDTPPQPVKKWLTTAPASLPPVNTDLATFEVANYLAPPQIYLFRTVARLLVQKLGEASAYSLLDTLMSFNLSAFFSWYAQIMRVDDVPALVFKLLGTQPSQSQGIVVIRDTPEAFRHLKHSICKAFKARADTGQGSDAFRVVVLPYPILTPPQIPVQRVSSSVEVLVRIQVTPEGNFSEPYHFNMIGAMRTTEDFFSWFSMEARYKQSSGVQALSFCFKDAAPSPITNCIERGNAQQFEYMKGDIQRRCYETLAYMPRMREFTVLVAVPGWIVPGWTVPRSMMPEERGLRFSNP
ncbi:hypothetical protein V498_03025 [Pseudogymnoascus sp. VKM F-4517 (FW-2822)]|nr:hypothetical protein V498_03025 [Pseudogymnoascus sp. VKM F-4517 (FW-2822)]